MGVLPDTIFLDYNLELTIMRTLFWHCTIHVHAL